MKNLYFSLLPDAEKAKYKTEKQWFKLGFVPVSQDAGTIMYSNRFCTGKYRYLTSRSSGASAAPAIFNRRKNGSKQSATESCCPCVTSSGNLMKKTTEGPSLPLRCPLTLKQRAWILTRMKYFKFQFWILTPGKFCWTAM